MTLVARALASSQYTSAMLGADRTVDSAHERARLEGPLMSVRKALETGPASCPGEKKRVAS